jgi:tetratricopeptide (TPR) repeat protein
MDSPAEKLREPKLVVEDCSDDWEDPTLEQADSAEDTWPDCANFRQKAPIGAAPSPNSVTPEATDNKVRPGGNALQAASAGGPEATITRKRETHDGGVGDAGNFKRHLKGQLLDIAILLLLLLPFTGPLCWLAQFPAPYALAGKPLQVFPTLLLNLYLASWTVLLPVLYFFYSSAGTIGRQMAEGCKQRQSLTKRPNMVPALMPIIALTLCLSSLVSAFEFTKLFNSIQTVGKSLTLIQSGAPGGLADLESVRKNCPELAKLHKFFLPLPGSPSQVLERAIWSQALANSLDDDTLIIRADALARLHRYTDAALVLNAVIPRLEQQLGSGGGYGYWWQTLPQTANGHSLAQVYRTRAEYKLQKGSTEGALADARRSLAIDPFSPEGYELRSRILSLRGAAAESAFDQQIAQQMRASPDYIKALGLRGKWFDAELSECAENALAQGAPEIPVRILLAALVSDQSTNNSKSLEHVDRAISKLTNWCGSPPIGLSALYQLRAYRDPNSTEKLRDLQFALLNLEADTIGATREDSLLPADLSSRFAFQVNPGVSEYEVLKRCVAECIDLKKTDEALGYIRRALAINCDYRLAYDIAKIAPGQDDKLVVEALTRFRQQNPYGYKFRTELARALAALKRFDEALQELDLQLRSDPSDSAAQDLKTKILKVLKQSQPQ